MSTTIPADSEVSTRSPGPRAYSGHELSRFDTAMGYDTPRNPFTATHFFLKKKTKHARRAQCCPIYMDTHRMRNRYKHLVRNAVRADKLPDTTRNPSADAPTCKHSCKTRSCKQLARHPSSHRSARTTHRGESRCPPTNTLTCTR